MHFKIRQGPEPSIPKLYEELTKITDTKGEGSQDQKINIINQLLRQCTPIAAKYVINIIVSNLRIGIADMSIMDALAIAFTGDKVNRQIIERAYNLDPDLGEIAEILAQKGIEVVAQISISVGIPIRMMLASRVPYAQIQGKLGGEISSRNISMMENALKCIKKVNKFGFFPGV